MSYLAAATFRRASSCARQRENRATKMQRLLLKERKEEKEQEEGEEVSETFERSTTLHKSDRSHDGVQPITSTSRAKIVPTIRVGERFRNNGRLASDEDSKSATTSEDRKAAGSAESKIRRSCSERSAR